MAQTPATSITPNIDIISQVINESIAPAVMGGEYTVNANLDNIVDMGTTIANLQPDQLKAPLTGLLRQIVSKFDLREYIPNEIPLYIEPSSYNAVVQSIKTGFLETDPNRSVFALTPGQVYDQVNTYYGIDYSNLIYTDSKTWAYSRSIPRLLVNKSFMSGADTTEFIALLNIAYANTVRRDTNALAHNLLSGVGLKSTTINLVTEYNTLIANDSPYLRTFAGTIGTDNVNIKETFETVTSENAIYNPVFMRWAAFTIKNVIEKGINATTLYNDGTIPAWFTDGNDTVVMLHSIFANAYEMVSDKTTDLYNGRYYVGKVSYWNALGDSHVPTLADSASIISNSATPAVSGNNTSVDNVIAIVYDRYAAGYTYYDIPTRVSYNEAVDFYNYFDDKEAKYYIDRRNNSVTFTLN